MATRTETAEEILRPLAERMVNRHWPKPAAECPDPVDCGVMLDPRFLALRPCHPLHLGDIVRAMAACGLSLRVFPPLPGATFWVAWAQEWANPELPWWTDEGPTPEIAAARALVAAVEALG